MTEALLLAPQGSDETLYAAYTCLRWGRRMHVIVCMQEADPTIRNLRSAETSRAIGFFGCTHHEWPMAADKPDWEAAKRWLGGWTSGHLFATKIEHVFAPAIDPAGPELHNAVGLLASEVFEDEIITPYLTEREIITPYLTLNRISGPRVTVAPPTGHEVACKLRALASYESLMPGLVDHLDLREWWAK